MTARRKHPEDALHMAIAQFLDLALPEDACWDRGGADVMVRAYEN